MNCALGLGSIVRAADGWIKGQKSEASIESDLNGRLLRFGEELNEGMLAGRLA